MYEIGQALSARMHVTRSIEIMPLARALATLQNRPKVISLWTGRIQEREHQVQWIAPVFHDAFSLYTLKSKAPANALEQARRLTRIGANIAGANILAARANGLSNVQINASDEFNGRMLFAGHIQGWIATEGSVAHFVRQQGLPADTLVKGVMLIPYDAYLAASKDCSAAEISQWAQALRSIQKDGTYAAILKRYELSRTAALAQ